MRVLVVCVDSLCCMWYACCVAKPLSFSTAHTRILPPPFPALPGPPPPSHPLEKALAKTAAEVTAAVPGAAVAFYVCDLSKRDAIYAAAEKVQASEGHPDVVLNNAGVVSGSYFLDTSDAKNELTMKVRRAAGQAAVASA